MKEKVGRGGGGGGGGGASISSTYKIQSEATSGRKEAWELKRREYVDITH